MVNFHKTIGFLAALLFVVGVPDSFAQQALGTVTISYNRDKPYTLALTDTLKMTFTVEEDQGVVRPDTIFSSFRLALPEDYGLSLTPESVLHYDSNTPLLSTRLDTTYNIFEAGQLITFNGELNGVLYYTLYVHIRAADGPRTVGLVLNKDPDNGRDVLLFRIYIRPRK